MIVTDGFSVSFVFSSKRKMKDLMGQDLELSDFITEKANEFFRPCAVDLGIINLITAAYVQGPEIHEIRSFSKKEYNDGIWQKTPKMNKDKEAYGVKTLESNFPTVKKLFTLECEQYVRYFFRHKDGLFKFYGSYIGKLYFYITKAAKRHWKKLRIYC